MLRTRSPRAGILYCYRKLRVRLACVKHAASVRSEPGSNSHLKPVSRPRRFASWRSRRTVKSFGCSQWPSSRYTQDNSRNQTGSGLFHPIVKEQVLPGQLEGLQTDPHPITRFTPSQAQIQIFFGTHQKFRSQNFFACDLWRHRALVTLRRDPSLRSG